MSDIKFPLKVYTYGQQQKEWKGRAEYQMVDLTEKEMADKCCIFGCSLYWRDSIPKEEYCLISENWVELYDIWNYECCNWWDWPTEQKKVMYQKVPKSRRRINEDGTLI